MSAIGTAAAVVGAAAWVLPWASVLLGAESPVFWHPAHAVAGAAWSLAFLAHATRWREAAGVTALRAAALAAAAFSFTNAGEAITGNTIFVLPYGLSMLAMCVAALVAGVQGLRDLVLPRPAAFARLGVAAFPVALPFGAVGAAAGVVALIAYGAAWLWFGIAGARGVVEVAA